MIPQENIQRFASVQLSLLELERAGEVTLTLKGNCMWPVVCDGDKITIKKFEYVHLRLGDVAIFQTTAETFHANTQFRSIKRNERTPENFIGKVAFAERRGEKIDLDKRSMGFRLWQAVLSPANPYCAGLLKTFWKKLSKSWQ